MSGAAPRAIVSAVTLDEIFSSGHSVGMIRNPLRRAVKDREAFWIISPAAAAAFLRKKQVDPSELKDKVDPDAANGDWMVDYAHCWCRRCSESRRLSQTSDGM